MGERTRAFDWGSTSLGPTHAWPQGLKTVVQVMLDSRYAMWLGWGPEFVFFYNDAYARMTLGPKHPWALGRPAREVWSEIWDDIGPRAESVVRTGRATWDEGLLLFLERRGFPEETYHSFSYSPVSDDRGGIGGIFCVVAEDTERTIGERRLRTLRELAARTTDGPRDVEQACQAAARILEGNPKDVPFVLFYLLDADGRRLTLAAQSGVERDSPISPAVVDLKGSDAPWPFRRVGENGVAVEVSDLPEEFGPLPGGAWPEPAERALVLPMASPGQSRMAGFIVAGVSPRRPLDDGYRGFLDLLAGQVAAAVANARAYEEERRRAERLAELDRAKTAFFSNVSHEFRTPLTLMLGPVEDILAKPEGAISEDERQLLEVVNRNGLRLLRLVNALLDFSRIEAGRVRASYEPTDLAAFTTDLASVFRSACDRAGLALTVECSPVGEPVFVDREMWEKVVLNLLSNAFKFTFEGEIVVSLRRVGGAVELRVRDTGTGIPAREMPRLFERFHRVENARGRTHEGSGIGLALVQELVRLHGGSVSAESVVGEGTTFLVSVPLGSAHLPPDQIDEGRGAASPAAGAAPFVEEALRWLPDERRMDAGPEPGTAIDGEIPDAPSPSGERVEAEDRARVLLADDNADMRQYIARLLGERFRVIAVPDGEAALAEASERPPDLILTDVMMPRLDGIELLRALRADPRTGAVPVIMLSARAGEESRVEGMEAGADDYLVKPFGARELLARVSAHLQIARMRKEANESLRRGEERLRMALVVARMVAWEFEPATGLLIVSENAADVFGLPPGSTLETGEQGFSLLHPDDVERHREEVARAADGDGGHLCQYRLIRPDDGSVIWLEERVHAVRDERSGSTRVVGVAMDVTQRVRADRLTLQRSEQLRRLAEVAGRINTALDVASVCGVVTVEARHVIGAHQSVIGFSVDQNWGQAINAVSLSEKYDAWKGYSARPDGSGIYSVIRRANRPMRLTQAELEAHAEWNGFGEHAADHPPMRGWLAAPLVARDGRNIGLIQLSDKFEGEFTEDDEAVLVQLAQMASVAIENARLVEDLRVADRRKDEFLATLAHELRNPLAPIRNGLQIMRLAGDDPRLLDEARSLMDRQVSHMVRLIDDLMDVSRITRDKLELRKDRVDLAAIVQAAVDTSRPLVEASGHELSVTLPARPVAVDADATRLAQVFSNLLNNAAKYTEAGGAIALIAERRAGDVLVTVRDNGVGIPPEMLPHIFDMFTQVDRTLERAQGGLGIGLTLVRRLVEMHGGSVEARSRGEGLGSEFVVRLPTATPAASRPSIDGDVTGPAIPTTGWRILVVDDNADSARTLARLLKLMGNETRTAHDGGEAVAVAEEYRPELMLLDIGLPVLNGYDVARAIRGRPWGRDVVIVALTGWGQEGDRRRSKEAGIDDHLVKPVDPSILQRLLSGLRA